MKEFNISLGSAGSSKKIILNDDGSVVIKDQAVIPEVAIKLTREEMIILRAVLEINKP